MLLELYIELFWAFFVIGMFTIGGGYAMLSLIQNEVVTVHNWIDDTTFTDIVAISQMTPGPISINMATYVGYSIINNTMNSQPLAIAASLITSLALMLPSLILMTIISRYLLKYSKGPTVNAIFSVLRPTVVGLIASAALLLMTSENYGTPTGTPLRFWVSVIISIAAFTAVRRKVNPILILVLSGLFTGVLYSIVE